MVSRVPVVLGITLLTVIGLGVAPAAITGSGIATDHVGGNGGFLAGVASAEGSISITVTEGTVEPGNTVTLQATKDGETIGGAIVELDPPGSNEPEQQTNADGTVTITVPDTRVLQVAVQTENASGVREFEVGGGTPTPTPDGGNDDSGDEPEETETPPERTPPPDEEDDGSEETETPPPDGEKDDDQEGDREGERNQSAPQEFTISVTDGTVKRGNTITLRTTLDGEPVSGATVRVQPPGPNPETLTTGSDGTTTITVPNASQVFVEVTAEDPRGFGSKKLLADDDREGAGDDGEGDRGREGDERDGNETEGPPPDDREGNETEGPPPEGREGNETEGPPPEGGEGDGEQRQEPESSLKIAVVEGTVAKNNEITVEITADGQPQSNATVMVLTRDSETELTTGSDGRVSVTVPDADHVELVAIKGEHVGQKELLGGDGDENETDRDGGDREQRPSRSSRIANVTNFECVANCDGVAMSEISTPSTYFSSGLKGVNVRLMAGSNRDLTTAGASTDTRFRLTVEVSPETGTFDPQTLVVIGDDGEIVSQSSGDSTTVTVEFTPTSGAVNFQDVDVEKPGNWPSRQITATTQVQAIAIVNIAEVGGTRASELKGMSISTDAQTFSSPTYVPPSNGGAGQIEINVAAPHFKTDGQTVNTGNFRAFIPDAVLSEWGVSNPEALTVGGLAQSGSISVSDEEGGVVVSASGYHYSSGSLTVTTTTAINNGSSPDANDSTEESTPTSAPVSLSVADASGAPNDTVTVTFNLTNTNATSLSGPALKVTDYPSSWAIDSHSDAGSTYSESSGTPTWLWLSISAGASKQPTITFDVPNSTQPGDYTITGQAQVSDGSVVNATGTVTISQSGSRTINDEIAGSDGRIGITDIQRAIRLWAQNKAVPNTGGKSLGIVKIQELIRQWASEG